MAVDLINDMGYRNNTFLTKMEESAVQEAASGLQSVNKLIRLLSKQPQNQTSPTSTSSKSTTPQLDLELNMDCNAVADVAVSKFRRVISLLGRTRTGHARFRRAPVPPPNEQIMSPPVIDNSHDTNNKVYYATPIQQVPPPLPITGYKNGVVVKDLSSAAPSTINFAYHHNNNNNNSSVGGGGSSFMSSLTSDQQQMSSSSAPFHMTNMTQVSSAGKPPLSSSLKRKCSSETLGSGKCSGSSSGRCHCSKKRKLRLKRVVRVPAISLKMADIPPDDYSWRKYGQKPIKGSPHPRGYYKCSSVRGCPARKHVERAPDDPSMLIVTYEDEHNHNLSGAETSSLILESS